MKSSLFGLSLLTGALAYPSLETRDDVQTAHLVFHGGPASYELAVKADGVEVQTSMSISLHCSLTHNTKHCFLSQRTTLIQVSYDTDTF